uniref:SLIT-ROBO Rho GTPase-activating protein 1 n=1 Tax=Cacopsylla melanoneura TaxID=428564 RepID=A0A8D8VAM9_9HEMI
MFQCIAPRGHWSGVASHLHIVHPDTKDHVSHDIRLQLNEQLRCLDLRMDTQTAVIGELQDYFRKRAEVELDYSKSLDKLAKSLQLRHKEQKQKREQWSLVSSFSCWQHLVAQTKSMSRDHALLSEIYSSHVINRFSQIIEDVQRIYKKCRDIAYELHEELMRVLHELHATTKAYLAYQTEARQAEAKLRSTEAARNKIEASLPKEKLERSKKFRVVEKEVQKRKNKYFDAKLKALKARNEYTLCLESSNATIHKYFVEDLSDLMDCMDFGFHHCVSRALLMHISAEQGRQKSESNGLDTFQNLVQGMDSRLDKQKFMEYNHSAFMIPKKFEFQGQKDEFAEPELQKLLCCEMETRLVQINQRLTALKTESEEIWKTLETAELSLLEMLTAKDYDCSESFINGHTSTTTSSGPGATTCAPSLTPAPPETVSIKLRADRHETEEFYLTKLREYLLGTSRIARLDTKQTHIRSTLLEQHSASPSSPPPHSLCSPSSENGHASSNTPPGEQLRIGSPLNGCLLATPASVKPVRRKRIGRSHQTSTPKLFGGSLEEYVEATGQEIPLVVRSCIRVINLYGLHHQGIFRVSGSQLEINSFKESFEKGEDALQDMTDGARSDMNSIAGVFKLYLRELREPLFPLIYFEQFMQLSQLESKHEFVVRMRDLLSSLPRPALVLLRYIFAFLNHLSEYADENMMDPYNLAICFGPTLVPVPDDKDQVQYQNQVNELIKNVILFSDDIFPAPSVVPGPVYEKYISAAGMMEEEELLDIGECPSESATVPTEACCPYPSEDECDSLEATAQFEFLARSERELSLKKGDHITLFSQVSNDWWRGSVHGHEGLIPDKYIMLKIKDETGSDKVESGGGGGLAGGGAKHSSCSSATPSSSSSSEESPLLLSSGRRRRVSSSNDSVVSGISSSAHIGDGAQSLSSGAPRSENISSEVVLETTV